MEEIDLDKFMGSDDPHFNANAQGWYFEFTGTKRPDCQMTYEVFIVALHEIYHFVLSNRNKPFAVLGLLKSFPEKYNLTSNDQLAITDRLLGCLSHHTEWGTFCIPFMQIVDYRHSISRYDQDPEIKEHRWEFDFNELKSTIDALPTYKEKMAHLFNILTDFQQRLPGMDELTQRYYLETRFVEKCVSEGQRIKVLEHLKAEPKTQQINSNQEKTLEEKMEIGGYYLKFLSGSNYAGREIMPESDHKHLLSLLKSYFETGQVPVTEKQLPQLNLPSEYIRYTFYLIHKKLFGTRRIQMSMIEFIHSAFSQFNATELSTTKTKFSTVPKQYFSDTGLK
jgi:hypothetical protein